MSTPFLTFVILLAGVTFLFYRWGRRRNTEIAERSARELEEALRPEDQSYTWIGGLIGYRVDYRVRRGELNRVEATLTMLPRHSLLYLPFSWIIRRSDALYLLFRPNVPLRGRGHLILLDHGSAPRVDRPEDLRVEELRLGRHRFRLLYGSDAAAAFLRRVAEHAFGPAGAGPAATSRPEAPVVRHLSINAEEGALYCRMIPVPGRIRPAVERLAAALAGSEE
ncbi:hypothetical protein [Limnochorda pilosa]|uniref:Uncharacterized protein n=1 Tax=Limnochorda pilosa TaxID=1555112 RepID=A0A0K2SPS3_LIMPI|nr:hypothetical protein [Limnochorda pilosa]BAS29133.1 hypothetical protein LIP_3320 [Limnochorda pilosa]